MEAPSEDSAEGCQTSDRMIRPIGVIRSCFAEKFGAPRQPGLVADAWGELRFCEEFRNTDWIRGLDGFSHVWLIFGFHETLGQGCHPTVRPPRLGGNERVGTFASRSTFRPNGLGLSVAVIESIKTTSATGPVLKLGGLDLIDGTPVYDIKPYLPFSDSLPEAVPGFASEAIPRLEVSCSAQAQGKFEKLDRRSRSIIREALALDPRPATSANDSPREFGMKLCDHNVRFRISGNRCTITRITKI